MVTFVFCSGNFPSLVSCRSVGRFGLMACKACVSSKQKDRGSILLRLSSLFKSKKIMINSYAQKVTLQIYGFIRLSKCHDTWRSLSSSLNNIFVINECLLCEMNTHARMCVFVCVHACTCVRAHVCASVQAGRKKLTIK